MPLAIPLAAIIDVIVAITAAILLYAAWRFKDNIANAIAGAIPVIGGAIATGFQTVVDLMIGGFAGWLSALTGPMAAWISTLYWPTSTLTNTSFHHVESLLEKFKQLRAGAWALFLQSIAYTDHKALVAFLWTADQIAKTQAAAYGLFLHAISWAGNEILKLAQYTDNLATYAMRVAYLDLLGLAAWTTNQLQALASYTGQLIHQAEVTAYTNLLGLAAWTTNQLQALAAYTATIVAQAEAKAQAEAQQAYAAAVSTVDQEAVGTVAGVWPSVAAPGQRVLDEVAAEYPGVLPGTMTVPQAVPLDLAQVLAGVEALAIPATIALDQCLLPMCRNLNNFGRDLSALENLFVDGAFFAFIAAVAADPKGVAREVDSILTPIVQEGHALFSSIAGTR